MKRLHLQLFNEYLGSPNAEGNWTLAVFTFNPMGEAPVIRKALPLRTGLTQAQGDALLYAHNSFFKEHP